MARTRTRHTIGPRLEFPRNGAWAGPQLSDLFCQWNEQAVEGREACTKKCNRKVTNYTIING